MGDATGLVDWLAVEWRQSVASEPLERNLLRGAVHTRLTSSSADRARRFNSAGEWVVAGPDVRPGKPGH
jgi:hypothetical protein